MFNERLLGNNLDYDKIMELEPDGMSILSQCIILYTK